MRKITTLLVFVFLLVGTNASFAQQTSLSNTDAASAQAFGLQIIQSYFNNDCDFVFDNLHSSLTSFEGGHTVQITPNMRKEFCKESPVRDDIQVSYQTYQENYTPEILDIHALNNKYPEWANHLNMQKGDYFFNGSLPKAAGATRVFKASDMTRFLLRKINGNWTIVAM